jgi:fructose-1,6-bisphosphatase/sedoheptulose 1,7-bisphosphatase-like protein
MIGGRVEDKEWNARNVTPGMFAKIVKNEGNKITSVSIVIISLSQTLNLNAATVTKRSNYKQSDKSINRYY